MQITPLNDRITAVRNSLSYGLAASATGNNYASTIDSFKVYFVQVYYGGYVGIAILAGEMFAATERVVSCMIGQSQGHCEIGYYKANNMVYVRCRSFTFAGTDYVADASTSIIVR